MKEEQSMVVNGVWSWKSQMKEEQSMVVNGVWSWSLPTYKGLSNHLYGLIDLRKCVCVCVCVIKV